MDLEPTYNWGGTTLSDWNGWSGTTPSCQPGMERGWVSPEVSMLEGLEPER